MRSSPGVIGAGSFREIRSSPRRPGACWISMPEPGTGPRWGPRNSSISADEKPSLQARRRKHPTLAPGPARPMRVEHDYFRTGALTYLAAWDVHHAKLFGRCEPKTTIGAVDRLVEQVMTTEPYRSARRVFWIADNCSSHRGEKAVGRFRAQWPTLTLVHTPGACQLAESSRDLLLDRPAQGRDTERLHVAARARGSVARVSSGGTSRRRNRFNGRSLGWIWPTCWPNSKPRSWAAPPDRKIRHRNYETQHLARGYEWVDFG